MATFISDTAREENEIRRDVNSELIYTSNLLDDTYDVAAKSRNRDQILLRDATKALVSFSFFIFNQIHYFFMIKILKSLWHWCCCQEIFDKHVSFLHFSSKLFFQYNFDENVIS